MWRSGHNHTEPVTDVHEWTVSFISDAEERYGPVWDSAEDAVDATMAFIDANPDVLNMTPKDGVDFWYLFQI